MRKLPASLSTLSGLGAIVLWSTTFALARSISEQVGPMTAGAAVYLIGGGFGLARLAVIGPSLRQLLGLRRAYLLGCGSLFAIYPLAIYLAVGMAKSREQLPEIALVNYLWPSLTVLLSLAILHNRATLWLIPGTGLALAGVLLVMTQGTELSWSAFCQNWRQNPAAYGLALAGAVSWAFYSNLTRRWSEPGSAGAVELFIPAAGLLLLGLRLLTKEPTAWTSWTITEAVGLAVATALSYVLWDVAMRRGNMLFVAACSYFTPLLSTFVTCVYLSVAPGSKLWIGCALLVSGSLITWQSTTRVRNGSDRANAK